MKAKLVALDCAGAQSEIVLNKLPVVIGCSDEAGVRVNDHDVSGFHCLLGDLNGTLLVRDLGSDNGTQLNGYSINESLVLPGDELTVGSARYQVCYERN